MVEDQPIDVEPSVGETRPTWRRRLLIGFASAVAVLAGLSVLGVDDVIDLPEWANVSGVDIPLLGDTDIIDCRLDQVDGTRRVEISIVDGDESTYSRYVHVWNNGNIVDPDLVDRPSDDRLISASKPGTDEQWYSISDEPVEEARVFCEMLVLE